MENYEKTKEKEMVCETELGLGSRLHVGKVLTPVATRVAVGAAK